MYIATVKHTRLTNGIRLEKGMSVELVSNNYSNPLLTNGGTEVINAFMRIYGVDIKKANAVSSAYIDVVKIGWI